MVKNLDVGMAYSIEDAVKKLGTLPSSAPLQSRQALENNYARLYQQEVKQGKSRQIKRKYR